jgi:tetrahydromethanopterin S-methyltransferase subunit G
MAGKGEGREITNLPLHVQETSRPATMADVEMVARRVTKLEQQLVVNANLSATSHDKMLSKLDDIRDRMDDKLCSVTDRLQEIGRAVGRLEGS